MFALFGWGALGHALSIGDGGGFLLLRSVRADCRFASGWRLIREYYGGMDCVFVIVVTIFLIVMCVFVTVMTTLLGAGCVVSSTQLGRLLHH